MWRRSTWAEDAPFGEAEEIDLGGGGADRIGRMSPIRWMEAERPERRRSGRGGGGAGDGDGGAVAAAEP